jgi:ABC-type sulfate/molybdate transport systems ATPase subunit
MHDAASALQCAFRKALPEFTLDVSLEMQVETLALVGRSGSGKSTTLDVIAGLVRPDAGSVRSGARMLTDVERGVHLPPERRGVGYQFQHFALFPHLDVTANIEFGLSGCPQAERNRRVSEALDLLGLQTLARAQPARLSGGERQRVALARAIVIKPSLLLLDEPLAALDAENRSRIRLDLRSLLKRLGVPAIVVSHDFEDARILGDRVAAVHRGSIVQTGTAAELAARPVDAFVAALTGTNLAPARNGTAQPELVAFDPWSARLSAHAENVPLEWRGEIVDIRPLGAFARVVLKGAADIKVDVTPEKAARFNVGDEAYASVPESAIRRVGRTQP